MSIMGIGNEPMGETNHGFQESPGVKSSTAKAKQMQHNKNSGFVLLHSSAEVDGVRMVRQRPGLSYFVGACAFSMYLPSHGGSVELLARTWRLSR